MTTWVAAGRGIRYREHKSRKHGQRLDRYWCIRYNLDGKYINEAVGWWSAGVSQKRCEEILIELRRNHRLEVGPQTYGEMKENERQLTIVVPQADESKIATLADVWPRYADWLRLSASPQSIRVFHSYMRTWFTPLQDKVFKQITTNNLEQQLVAPMLQAGKSPGTIEKAVGFFSSMWGWAKRQGLVSGPNPKSKVKRPLTNNRRDRFLSKAEASQLLQALKTRSTVTHDMALLSLFCGLRAGECQGVTWADIDFENGLIFVKDTKNKFSRHAYITEEVREMLMGRFQEQLKSAKVLLGPQGGEAYCTISTFFRDTVKALGFNEGISDRRQRVCFHTLRHTFASWLAQKGQPIYTIGKLLGHKAIKHTERYTHLAPQEQRAAVSGLEGLLK